MAKVIMGGMAGSMIRASIRNHKEMIESGECKYYFNEKGHRICEECGFDIDYEED